METSVILDTPLMQDQPELASSKSDEEVVEKAEIRLGSAPVTTIKLVTVSSTSFVFVPQTITSTKELTGVAGLKCLPSGFLACEAQAPQPAPVGP
jgi:hypothetical protein